MRRRGWQHLGLCVPVRWLHRQQHLLSMPHGLGHRDTGPFAYDSGSVADDAGPIDFAVANAESIVYEFDVYASNTFADDAWSYDAGDDRTNDADDF